MIYDSNMHHRHSIRLREYDYSTPGAYFVTICAHGKKCMFGEITNGEMLLSNAGQVVEMSWHELPLRFPSIELDAFIIMPNHTHGIIILGDSSVGAGERARVGAGLAQFNVGAGLALPSGERAQQAAPLRNLPCAPTLGDIMRVFKSRTAIQINRLSSPLGTPVWQRNYYEHIIRGETELNEIREYIIGNPLSWGQDRENPAFVKPSGHKSM